MLSIAHGPPLDQEPGLGALSIPAYLRQAVAAHGEREAAVQHHLSGEVERWSYNDLWQRSLEVARALAAAGIGKDGRVGLLMTNRLEYLSAAFGTALAGGVVVPLSTFSTAPELEQLLQMSAVSVLIFDSQVLKNDFVDTLCTLEPSLAQRGPIASRKFPHLRRVVALDAVTAVPAPGKAPGGAIERWQDFLAGGRDVDAALIEARADGVTPADVAALFFSSGTTSLPKGILHAQRAICVQWWRWPRLIGAQGPQRTWTGNGFFWSANFTMIIGVALSTGGAIVLQPTFQAEEALRLMQAERVTLPNGRPHQWARLQAAPNWGSADLSSLRYVDRRMALAQHPSVKSRDWQWPPSYGNTETLTINTSFAHGTPAERMSTSHGAPLPGNTLKVVDPLSGAVVPRGQRGEIAVKGATLMLGYVGKTPEEAFDDEGYFRTGDGGYIDEEDRLFWEGRLTEIIKTGGANVSPLEVDAALAACPGVRIAQTVGVPHDTLGEMVVSCIVPQEGAMLAEDAVRAWLKQRLASYKLPRRVLLLREDEVEVTGNGKVKLAELRVLAAARVGACG